MMNRWEGGEATLREGKEEKRRAGSSLVVAVLAILEGDGRELILVLGLDLGESGVVLGRVVDL